MLQHFKTSFVFRFNLQYKIILTDKSLQTELTISNHGNTAFDFTTLLHTYIKVSDVKQTTITGFENCVYTDKVIANFIT